VTAEGFVENLLRGVEHNVDIIEVDKKIRPDVVRWAKSTLQKPVEYKLIRPDYEGQMSSFRDSEGPDKVKGCKYV
jgi:hypothetical protein